MSRHPVSQPVPRRRRRKKCRALPLLLLLVLLIAGAELCLRVLPLAGMPELLSDCPQELQDLWERNPEARDFVEGYEENRNKDFSIDLSQEAASDTVPLLMQWDERWGYHTYSGGLMGYTGCGPTCLSMAALYLTGDASLSPDYVADFAARQGYAVPGSGTSWSLISEGAETLGMTSRELPLDRHQMESALDEGGLVICVLGPGDFTSTGHFILLTGYTEDGFTVNDPNSRANSEKTWSYDRLSTQIKNLWALSAA